MIHVIGFHSRALLPPPYLALIREAEILVGGRRHLAAFPDFSGKKLEIHSPVGDFLSSLAPLIDRRLALLASGDPLFFGIGKKLLSRFPAEKLAFYPAPTAFQLAFSRAKIPWDEAKVISLHGRSLKNLHLEIAPYEKVAFLTDPKNSPGTIAAYLLKKGLKGEAIICENLGLEAEKITRLSLEEVPRGGFSGLNVFILLKKSDPLPLLFGLPEEAFSHEGGLITKSYVRAVITSYLSPFPEAVIWDLGAGCGAVGLELARICFRGEAYLVEKNPRRAALIRENLSRFGLDNVILCEKDISEALEELPRPDLVFIGGGFKEVMENEEAFWAKLKPETKVVATFACLEHLTEALSFFRGRGLEVSFECLWGARGKKLPNQAHFLSAENPVFVLRALRKPLS